MCCRKLPFELSTWLGLPLWYLSSPLQVCLLYAADSQDALSCLVWMQLVYSAGWVGCRSVSTAGRGEPSADRLTGQGPWSHSQGHLMHMASHTFVRLGRYHDGVQANVRAFAADLDDSQHCRVPYLPEHNLEMLIYAATLGGEVISACLLLCLCMSMWHMLMLPCRVCSDLDLTSCCIGHLC